MYRFIKRTFDIFASGLALIVLLPIWLIAIIGIEVSDPGPVFYFANRAGKDNKTFKMYKFRSMRVDKNANEKSLRPDQDRIFKFGRFIRATKIDEWPQLLNVFFKSCRSQCASWKLLDSKLAFFKICFNSLDLIPKLVCLIPNIIDANAREQCIKSSRIHLL